MYCIWNVSHYNHSRQWAINGDRTENVNYFENGLFESCFQAEIPTFTHSSFSNVKSDNLFIAQGAIQGKPIKSNIVQFLYMHL